MGSYYCHMCNREVRGDKGFTMVNYVHIIKHVKNGCSGGMYYCEECFNAIAPENIINYLDRYNKKLEDEEYFPDGFKI
jgi:hypothetical protein